MTILPASQRAREIAKEIADDLAPIGMLSGDCERGERNELVQCAVLAAFERDLSSPAASGEGDAIAKALCLLDSLAGDGLCHTYGNGQTLSADEVCAEVASAFSVPLEPGWYRLVGDRFTRTPSPAAPSAIRAEAGEGERYFKGTIDDPDFSPIEVALGGNLYLTQNGQVVVMTRSSAKRMADRLAAALIADTPPTGEEGFNESATSTEQGEAM